jgi:hypothetical protein
MVQYCRSYRGKYAYDVVGKFCEYGFALVLGEGTHGVGLTTIGIGLLQRVGSRDEAKEQKYEIEADLK